MTEPNFQTYYKLLINFLKFNLKNHHFYMRYKIFDQKGLNFITITVVDWVDLFTRKAICEIVLSNESRKDWLLNHFQKAAKLDGKGRKHKVWQNGNRPIELYTPKVIRQKLNYIHRNPVASGIVDLPEHYLYSSASNYQKAHLPEQQSNCKLEIDLLEGIWNDEGFVFMGR